MWDRHGNEGFTEKEAQALVGKMVLLSWAGVRAKVNGTFCNGPDEYLLTVEGWYDLVYKSSSSNNCVYVVDES